jgi:hypothetical protein
VRAALDGLTRDQDEKEGAVQMERTRVVTRSSRTITLCVLALSLALLTPAAGARGAVASPAAHDPGPAVSTPVFVDTTTPSSTPTSTTPTGTTPTGTTPTSTTTTPSTTTTGSTTSTEGGPDTSGTNEVILALAILVLGAAAIVFAYIFFDRWRGSYQVLAQAFLQKTGTLPVVEFPPEDTGARGTDQAPDASQDQLVIKGPASVIVGDPVVYAASTGDDKTAWAIDPAGAATLVPASGAQTTLTALRAGSLTLTATIGGGAPTTAKLTAVAKPSGGVPVLGTGFAGTIAAIVAFALAAALVVFGDLTGEAFIAFLGPVVGYFFAHGRNGSGGDSNPQGGGSSAPSG